jgi:hypothetical protein
MKILLRLAIEWAAAALIQPCSNHDATLHHYPQWYVTNVAASHYVDGVSYQGAALY